MLKFFKIIALLEGVSLLALLFFAMPMKYVMHDPFYVKHVGMAHGILFIGYIVLAFMLMSEQKWPLKKFAIVCAASVIPGGTFYVDSKYFKAVS